MYRKFLNQIHPPLLSSFTLPFPVLFIKVYLFNSLQPLSEKLKTLKQKL
jgi:hypothetical protein